MIEPVWYYNGFEITDEIIKKVNLIELKRIKEKITNISCEKIDNLKDLCLLHGTMPQEEYIVLGMDWYVIYTRYNDNPDEIEINEWVAINNVENKLMQTIEMFNTIKNILLDSKKVYATMRHSTSYKFYKLLLNRGYIEELSNVKELDDELPNHIELKKNELQNQYSSLEEYLSIDNDIKQDIDDYIFHLIIFRMTDKFTKRYKKTYIK